MEFRLNDEDSAKMLMEFRKKNQIMCYMTEIGKIVTALATATADCCDETVSQETAISTHLTKIKSAATEAAYYAGLYFEEDLHIQPEYAYSVEHPVEMLFDVIGNLIKVGGDEIDSFCIEWDNKKTIKVRTIELNLQLVLAVTNSKE